MYDGPPVVVVGNGPVGQTTALLLARWGIPTVVLDAHERREVIGSRSICQQRATLEIWDSVGAGWRIADEGVTWQVARTYFRERELFHVDFADCDDSPLPPWVNIAQSRVEQVLDERIAATPAIEIRWGTTVTEIIDHGDSVTVETTAGPIETPYVVGAAGARGEAVRRAVGAEFVGRSFEDHFVICDIRCDLPERELERRFHFDPGWNPGRQVLMHPCPNSTYRIDWQVPPDFDLERERTSGELDARIRMIVGAAAYEVVWCTVYRFHSRLAATMGRGRVLLAGDVAHLMAPFGARGLNSGVADAENAAWRLAYALHGWAAPRIVEEYAGERRAAAEENLAITTRTMDFLVPQSEAGWAHRRDVLERAVTDPDARTEIDSGKLYAPFRYGDDPDPAVGALHPERDVRAAARVARGDFLTHTAHGETWVVRPDGHVAGRGLNQHPPTVAVVQR
jgi:3-(3-hydroxy-phenyl)propionate hydroxylase